LDPRPAPEAVARWRLLNSSVVQRGTGHKPLPGTALEVKTLAALLPGSTTLLGSQASEQTLDALLAAGRLGQYRVLHFATHGETDDRDADRCRIILAQDRLPDPRTLQPEDKVYTGELTVQTIRANWKLDADLVVLSACQTALGKEGQGEGLL